MVQAVYCRRRRLVVSKYQSTEVSKSQSLEGFAVQESGSQAPGQAERGSGAEPGHE